MTCWHRVRDWNDASAWQRLHEILLGKPAGAVATDRIFDAEA
ncbi:hypothetical protein ABTW72_19475 [Micromonospora sp. NPDC127501]